MNKKFKGHTIASAGIGLMVANISLLFHLSEYIGVKSILNSFIISGIIGILIGFIARKTFNYVSKFFFQNIIWAYIIEGILVFIVTVGITYLLGQREFKYILIAGSVALVLAMLFTFIKVKEFRELNAKLKEFQSEKESHL